MHPLLISNLYEGFRFENSEIVDQYVEIGIPRSQSDGDFGDTEISNETFYFRGPVFLLDRVSRFVDTLL
jgi:hypothetical protein